MKIALTGGGSGGHITPLLAVAHELKTIRPDAKLIYIGQKGDKLADVPAEHPEIDEAYAIRAGKLRRYGLGLKQLRYPSIHLKNLRDAGRTVQGLAASRRLLKKIKPDVIFIKGGFVGVPVGLAAASLGIPFITHDSDAIPGLANRIIAKWAAAHAVALPKEVYPYPAAKTFTVGVPVNSKFESVAPENVKKYRQELGLAKFKQVIFVTGGGNGARKLNQIVAAAAPQILSTFPEAAIVHVAGRDHEEEVQTAYNKALPQDTSRIFVKGFVSNLYEFSAAADLIIARGSATNLAEFAIQRKACIVVPAKQLAWTEKNSAALAERNAAIVLDEDAALESPGLLGKPCIELLQEPQKRNELAKNLGTMLAHPNAARELAELLLKYSRKAK